MGCTYLWGFLEITPFPCFNLLAGFVQEKSYKDFVVYQVQYIANLWHQVQELLCCLLSLLSWPPA